MQHREQQSLLVKSRSCYEFLRADSFLFSFKTEHLFLGDKEKLKIEELLIQVWKTQIYLINLLHKYGKG